MKTVFTVVLALGCAGCSRGCDGRAGVQTARVTEAGVRAEAPSERCVSEVGRASWFEPGQSGEIDAVWAVCDRDRLGVFVSRGHTLYRAVRPRVQASEFGAVTVLSSGVDRLGPVPDDGVDGPVAWRAPTVSDEESDQVWVARLDASHGDGGDGVQTAAMEAPRGGEALGIVVPVGGVGGFGVLASWASEAWPARTFAVSLRAEDTVQWGVWPERGGERQKEGELLAWAFGARAGLYRGVAGDGGVRSELVVQSESGDMARVELAPEVMTMANARGGTWRGRGVFLVGTFTLGRRGDGCAVLGRGICVRPGEVLLVIEPTLGGDGGHGGHGGQREARKLRVGDGVLPDAMAVEGDWAVVLMVEPGEGGVTRQRAARVSLVTGEVRPLVVSPPRGMGDVDHLTVVSCGDGPWMALEVRVNDRAAVVALPLECVVRGEENHSGR